MCEPFCSGCSAGELIGAPVDFSQTPKSGVDFGPHVFGSPDPDLAILRSCPDLIELDNTVIQDKPTLAEMLNAGNDVEESPLDTTEIISDVPVEITTEDSPLDTTEIITDTPEEIMADDPSQDTPEVISETPEEMTTTGGGRFHSEAEVGDSRPESVVDAAMDATLVSEETQASEPGSLAPSDAGSLMMGASGSEASLSRSQSEEIGLPSIPEAVEEEKDMFEDTQPQTASSSSSPKPVPIPRSHSGSKVKGKRQPAQLISLSQPVGPAATAHAEAEVKQRRRGRTASVAKKPEEEPPAQRRAPPRRAKQAAVEKMHVANIRTKRGQSVDSAGTSQPKISRAASHK
ncbi:uncharacterized protein LOC129594871 [Paramacrobiotus metropolitanus]|uniref:uncharacterized protein LOC129594871 n=1 Tax=Paramacrobiotus metropolitanus TaxID=2943436 RepID=UPI002445BB04|nr:uncharacterized protein LOC129594871 [Paramacrobiotus metropolitanus]